MNLFEAEKRCRLRICKLLVRVEIFFLNFAPEYVYVIDEIVLRYFALSKQRFLFKNKIAKGCKISKDRLKILYIVNFVA